MNAFILVFLLLFTESQGVCLPDSLSLKTVTSRTVEDFKKIEDAVSFFQQNIEPSIPNDHNLIVRLEPLNSRVNALIKKDQNELTIEVYGGVLNHSVINENTLLLLLCHEIGHYLGGPPLQSRGGWSSTEGQADYFSAASCARVMGLDEVSFLDAAQRLTKLYAEVRREPAPRLDSCDERITQRTNFGYPPVQCRLDTLVAGWMGQDRPKCWFKEN